jgi:hypothetical protein
MTMNPSLRKFALTAHVTLSVGWLGAVVAYLALAIVGLTSQDAQMVRAAYLSMEVIGWFVIVPFSLAALLAGLVESLGTPWGLLRHWWVLVKFLLTTAATIVLLWHMQAVTRMSGAAADIGLSATDFRALRIQLVVHAGGGLLVLLAATVLSIYKPWGLTPYGRSKQYGRQNVSPVDVPFYPGSDVEVGLESTARTPRWVYVVGIHAIGLALLFLVVHLAGGGLPSH